MGQPEQFAKRTFASDAEHVTRGGVAWKAPPEIGLVHVQADGLLLVKDPARLIELAAPWPAACRHSELQVELKMPGDHTDAVVIERGLLRRQARQVERMEEEAQEPPWRGQEPLWWVAPHVPRELVEYRALRRFAPGCYRVSTGIRGFDFLWIAANELPLREELIPFLVVRSGRALDAFALWVADRRPVDWVLDLVEYTSMSVAVRKDIVERYTLSSDPEVRERQLWLARTLLDANPQLTQAVRLDEARSALRHVLARRGLTTSAEDEARIDACADLAALRRWHDEAVTAPSAAEALR